MAMVDVALTGVAGVHAGFQLTVSLVVYPALASARDDWASVHAAHSTRITRLVAPLYAALVATAVWALLEPGGWRLATAGLGLGAVVVTAVAAAPAHQALARGRDERVLRRLLIADWARTALAVASLGAAVVASST